MTRRSPEPINPFYVLLVIVGIAFCLTACAYGMMTVRAARGGAIANGSPPSALIDFLDRHGARLMAGEIALLAVATFAAMGTDRRRSLRSEAARRAKSGTAGGTASWEQSAAEKKSSRTRSK